MDDIKLIEKWKYVLDYYCDTVNICPAGLRLGCAKAMDEMEREYDDKLHVRKILIPMIRQLYPYHIIEKGQYTPTKEQDFYGHTFEALKIFNTNYKQSKYQAVPLDEKYFEDDIRSATDSIDVLARYPFDF